MFHLPGVDKLDAFDLVFNKGVDTDVRLLGQFSKSVLQHSNDISSDIWEVERYLNGLEKTQSVFTEPVKNMEEIENISIDNNIQEDERIPIPDAEIYFHTDFNQQEQTGSVNGEESQHPDDFIRRQQEVQETDQTRNIPFEERNQTTDEVREIVII